RSRNLDSLLMRGHPFHSHAVRGWSKERMRVGSGTKTEFLGNQVDELIVRGLFQVFFGICVLCLQGTQQASETTCGLGAFLTFQTGELLSPSLHLCQRVGCRGGVG